MCSRTQCRDRAGQLALHIPLQRFVHVQDQLPVVQVVVPSEVATRSRGHRPMTVLLLTPCFAPRSAPHAVLAESVIGVMNTTPRNPLLSRISLLSSVLLAP